HRAFRAHAERATPGERLLVHPPRGFDLGRLAFVQAAESLEQPSPRLGDDGSRGLDGPRPRELLLPRRRKHGPQLASVGTEDAIDDARVTGVETLQQRLEGPLSEIPLADAEADALIVEIPTEPGKTLRRTGVRLESTGERETAMRERLRHHRRWCDRGAV